MCKEEGLPFIDFGVVGKVSGIDGIHFDKVSGAAAETGRRPRSAVNWRQRAPSERVSPPHIPLSPSALLQESQSSLARAVYEKVVAQFESELA